MAPRDFHLIDSISQGTLVHDFRSCVGRWCVFRFDGNEVLFLGDHVVFREPE